MSLNTLNTVHHHGVQPSDHPCNLGVALQVPVLFPPDTSCQLDISGLDCDPLGMDGQKVGILHNGDQIVLSCLVKGFDGVSLPPQWGTCSFPPLHIPYLLSSGRPSVMHPVWPHLQARLVPGTLPESNSKFCT